jgi:hypothetical protein
MKNFRIAALLTALPFSAGLLAEPVESPEPQDSALVELSEEVKSLRDRLSQLEALLAQKLGASSEPASAAADAEPPEHAALQPARDQVRFVDVAVTDAEPQSDEIIGPASTGGQTLRITGLLDTYYTTNFNHPEDGTNTLYYTNPNARGFGLNQAKLEIDASGDGPVGFRSDIWFGSGARLFRDGLEPGPLEDVLYLQQAYGYYQWDNGAELDVGLFGTIAGLEVAESHLNWNYTRGILWAWNEPFSHLGAKLSVPLSDTFTSTVMLVNGFDNAFDQNSGKSYGLQGSWAPNDRFNTTLTWINGPENAISNEGWQKDLSWNFYAGLHEKFEVMANLDYIQANDATSSATSWGMGYYARISPTEKFRIAGRYEFLDDEDGRSTGVNQNLDEFTLTFEYAPEPRFITRLEYRRDWSDVNFFSRGAFGPGGELNLVDDQDTLTLAFMWVFGPKE